MVKQALSVSVGNNARQQTLSVRAFLYLRVPVVQKQEGGHHFIVLLVHQRILNLFLRISHPQHFLCTETPTEQISIMFTLMSFSGHQWPDVKNRIFNVFLQYLFSWGPYNLAEVQYRVWVRPPRSPHSSIGPSLSAAGIKPNNQNDRSCQIRCRNDYLHSSFTPMCLLLVEWGINLFKVQIRAKTFRFYDFMLKSPNT